MNVTGILNALVSHAAASGLFEAVNQHEPKSAPGNGLACAIWAQSIGPAPGASGLANTTGLVVFTERLYQNFLSDPHDAIDPNLLTAVDTLMTAYSGDLELGGTVREVDLLGEFGPPLSAKAGYLTVDKKHFRVMDITLPVVVNDLWPQAP